MPNALLIENNLELSNMLVALLRLEGHGSELIKDADHVDVALIAAPEGGYHLVVVDMDAPHMSTEVLLKAIGGRHNLSDKPLVLLVNYEVDTAKLRSTIEESGFTGSIDFLRKPVEATDLALLFKTRLPRKLDPSLFTSGIYPALPPKTLDGFVSEGTLLDGKYRLLKLVGGGSTCHVYKAESVDGETHLAVKILSLSTLRETESLSRFQREAKLNSALSHANIVAVKDYGISDHGQPYLVMELLEGASLLEVVERHGRPTLNEVLSFFKQVCEGLHYAHEQGIVHRDIKPSNMMVTGDGETGFTVKIVDFGLARMTESDAMDHNVTLAGHVVGSPPYMSPEQCRGELVDYRSDIYSLGCSLYEMLHGKYPYEGDNPVQIMIRHLKEAPPVVQLADANPEVNRRLSEIIGRCMAKERDQRLTAAEAAQLISDCMEFARPQDSSQAPWAPKKKVLNWLAGRFTP